MYPHDFRCGEMEVNMKNILLLDTSVGSLNKGDEIIMRCVKEELEFLLRDNFILNIPTHLSPFNSYQVLRNSNRVQIYKDAILKFVGGTNLLIPNLFTHFPQWNINFLNYKPIKGCILVGVGAGPGKKSNLYTKTLYKKILNTQYYHSVRDERSKTILENYGLKAINTGCVTMWKLTPEFCNCIPISKSDNVVFTLTAKSNIDVRDQILINILNKNYKKLYFWPQGYDDYNYLMKFEHINNINIIDSDLNEFEKLLSSSNIEYVGTRLHGGIFAMRNKKRSIIIVIDERAREINKSNNLNCIEKSKINELELMINSDFATHIKMPLQEIERWKGQFQNNESVVNNL